MINDEQVYYFGLRSSHADQVGVLEERNMPFGLRTVHSGIDCDSSLKKKFSHLNMSEFLLGFC